MDGEKLATYVLGRIEGVFLFSEDIRIDFDTIAHAAYDGIPPENMGNVENNAYEALFWLYRNHADGRLDHEYCRKRKHDIKMSYRHGCMLMEMFEVCCRREVAIRGLSLEIETNGTEREKRLVAILDGREKA